MTKPKTTSSYSQAYPWAVIRTKSGRFMARPNIHPKDPRLHCYCVSEEAAKAQAKIAHEDELLRRPSALGEPRAPSKPRFYPSPSRDSGRDGYENR